MSSENVVAGWCWLIGGYVSIISFGVMGIYLGVWVYFIGGIVDVVDAIKSTPVDALQMGIGIAKFFFSGVAGFIVASIGFIIGKFMIDRA